MTKLAILSDIHTEFENFDPEILLADNPDIVILAGDIGVGTGGVIFAKSLAPTPVIYVPGNHEHYHHDFHENLRAMRDLALETDVYVLDRGSVVVDGILFLGATLWADYNIYGDAATSLANAKLNDQRLIRYGSGMFTTATALQEHKDSKGWLDEELELYYDDPGVATVVVTHHAPHPNSIAPKYRDKKDRLTPAFVSDLSELIAKHKIDLWVHGHDHNNHNYTVDGTRIVSSQKGYPGECPDWKVLNIEI